jgi:hypothetical protein
MACPRTASNGRSTLICEQRRPSIPNDRAVTRASSSSARNAARSASAACRVRAAGSCRDGRRSFIATAAGELGLVQGGKASVNYSHRDLAAWHGMLAHIAAERGYKPGWVAHKFKEKFGTWPAWGTTPEQIRPTPEVLSWVRSRQIAFAKRRAA